MKELELLNLKLGLTELKNRLESYAKGNWGHKGRPGSIGGSGGGGGGGGEVGGGGGFKKALDLEVKYGDAGAWLSVIDTIKERYKHDPVGNEFDPEVFKHLDKLKNIFELGMIGKKKKM